MINLIFKEFLFASYFKAQEDKKNGVKKEVKLVMRVGSNKNQSTRKTVSNHKSREAAFSLLIELVRKSGLLLENFLQTVLMPMLN